MNIPVIDSRMLEMDDKWREYCILNNIRDPFAESQARLARRMHEEEDEKGHRITVIDAPPLDEQAWQNAWAKRRDAYLRLQHTFRLWDFHFWMPWEEFKRQMHFSRQYADVGIYMPCDAAERQCNMECAYFGAKCPREEEPLKCPINKLENNYEN